MSSPEAYDDISGRLTAGWTATPLVFENDPYTLPATPAPFLYVEIFGDDFDQVEVGERGQNMWEERGIAYLHVMVPNDTGSGEARTYAKQALNLFREQQIGSIRTVKMSIGQGQPGRSFANYWAMTTTLWWARYDFTDLT
jgi:hypothetical protein